MNADFKANVLVVDDDRDIVEAIARLLEKEGYNIYRAYDGIEALDAMVDNDIHLMLIDVMMPNMDGLSAIMKIRQTKNIPIIVLSAKSEDTDKVLGLSVGADDYISKPFGIREMMARIKAVLRRFEVVPKQEETKERVSVITVDDLVIDIDCHEVRVDDRQIELTLKEFELLKFLVENRGHVFTRDQLLNNVWGIDYMGETRTVDVHIRHLRQKLSNGESEDSYIKTVRGKGYKVK